MADRRERIGIRDYLGRGVPSGSTRLGDYGFEDPYAKRPPAPWERNESNTAGVSNTPSITNPWLIQIAQQMNNQYFDPQLDEDLKAAGISDAERAQYHSALGQIVQQKMARDEEAAKRALEYHQSIQDMSKRDMELQDRDLRMQRDLENYQLSKEQREAAALEKQKKQQADEARQDSLRKLFEIDYQDPDAHNKIDAILKENPSAIEDVSFNRALELVRRRIPEREEPVSAADITSPYVRDLYKLGEWDKLPPSQQRKYIKLAEEDEQHVIDLLGAGATIEQINSTRGKSGWIDRIAAAALKRELSAGPPERRKLESSSEKILDKAVSDVTDAENALAVAKTEEEREAAQASLIAAQKQLGQMVDAFYKGGYNVPPAYFVKAGDHTQQARDEKAKRIVEASQAAEGQPTVDPTNPREAVRTASEIDKLREAQEVNERLRQDSEVWQEYKVKILDVVDQIAARTGYTSPQILATLATDDSFFGSFTKDGKIKHLFKEEVRKNIIGSNRAGAMDVIWGSPREAMDTLFKQKRPGSDAVTIDEVLTAIFGDEDLLRSRYNITPRQLGLDGNAGQGDNQPTQSTEVTSRLGSRAS